MRPGLLENELAAGNLKRDAQLVRKLDQNHSLLALSNQSCLHFVAGVCILLFSVRVEKGCHGHSDVRLVGVSVGLCSLEE